MASASWVPTATERDRCWSNSAMAMRDTGAGLRYDVIKTYAPSGPLRQYRLAASTSFGCFRCGLAKTSRLVTVFREDWNRLLGNGCYGLLLSLHDIRAGSAGDSERADALAEQLLALASEAEQREAMELLRIRSDQVDQLTERSQRLLATSEYVASHLANATDLEWSSAVVCVCKAVEVELVERLIEPVALECRDADLKGTSWTRNSDRSLDSVPAAPTSRRRWGPFAISCKTAHHSRSRKDTSSLLRALGRTLRRWPDSAWLLEPDGALVDLKQLADHYRNPAAHTDELQQSDFDGCHRLVLGDEGMLWALLRATQ